MSDTPDYGAFVEAPKTEDLTQLGTLIEKLHAAEMEVALAEEALKKKQAAVKTLAEIEIPELMARIGVKTFTTTTNLQVEVKDDVQASVKEADRPRAFAWLESNGHGGLIKSEVVVAFARAEKEKAAELAGELGKQYPGNVRQDQWVEPQTLKSFVKKRLEANEKVPEDIFSIRKFKVAKVKNKG